MATQLVAPTVAPYTSGDITLSAGTAIVFSITGTHIGDPVVVKKKDSQGAYWQITETAVDPSQSRTGEVKNGTRIITINNPSSTAMTLQVYKPPSGVASGIDQD
jgi:hypothetical protein